MPQAGVSLQMDVPVQPDPVHQSSPSQTRDRHEQNDETPPTARLISNIVMTRLSPEYQSVSGDNCGGGCFPRERRSETGGGIQIA